jgi:hypothetical protein
VVKLRVWMRLVGEDMEEVGKAMRKVWLEGLGMAGPQKGTKGLPVRVTAALQIRVLPMELLLVEPASVGRSNGPARIKEAGYKEANPTYLGLRGVTIRL